MHLGGKKGENPNRLRIHLKNDWLVLKCHLMYILYFNLALVVILNKFTCCYILALTWFFVLLCVRINFCGCRFLLKF